MDLEPSRQENVCRSGSYKARFINGTPRDITEISPKDEEEEEEEERNHNCEASSRRKD